jgi:hypothetical protein
VRRDVIAQANVQERAKIEQWAPDFTEYILRSAGASWLWSSFNRGDAVNRSGTRLFSDEMNKFCEVFYGFFRGADEHGNRQTRVVIFHPGTQEIGRELPFPYAHGKYPFILCRRESRSRSAFESRGVGDIADTAQSEIKT